MDFREIVLAELSRRKWSRYKLVQAVKDQMSASIVYGWLRGEHRITDDKLAVICEAIGIKVSC